MMTQKNEQRTPAEQAEKPERITRTEKVKTAGKDQKTEQGTPAKQVKKSGLTEKWKKSKPAKQTGKAAASSTKKGKMYEEQVAAYIKALGYQIREQNFRCFYGEIDLIAQKGKDLFFIEVKGQRQDYQAELKVNYAKRQRILNVSAEYLRCCNLWQDYAVHYDVAVVTGNQVHYYADAFEW